MLIIRKEQWEEFSRYMGDQFVDELMKYLLRKFPQKTEGELSLLIQGGIGTAQKYGITLEADVVRFLECMLTYGPRFDTDADTAWAGEILNNPELLGREKAKRLLQHLEMDTEGMK